MQVFYAQDFTKHIIFIVLLFSGLLASCAKKGPPAEVIKEAKIKTESIIERVKLTEETVTGTPEFVKERWNDEMKRYELEYYVETVFGAAITDSPTAYVVKEGDSWKYQFRFDKYYESVIEVK